YGSYPWFLKRRISSAQGHLSNEAAAHLVSELATGSLLHVVGLHLSTTNNTPRLAGATLTGALARLGHPAQVRTAAQDELCTLSG
ncbi:MAG: MBL fold metallo-hydrolase, partial [Coriobacteriia bacterium]|nr:MBL fold metallo-hydrolase [Coriobacteriia bacterium]